VHYLLCNEANKNFLMMPIRIWTNINDADDQKVEICLEQTDKGSNWLQIIQYKKLKWEQYNYFMNIIELSAELCLGRNREALDNLQEMFSFDSIKLVIKDRSLPHEMRALFLRMLLNMHMDHEPLECIQIPS